MLQVFAIQKTFSGFARSIPGRSYSICPNVEIVQVIPTFSIPFHSRYSTLVHFSSLFMLLPLKANSLGSL